MSGGDEDDSGMSSLFRRLLIFTDVDGCLLNKADYRYDAALPALERLRRLQVPLILCSSKTAAELSELHRELDLGEAPFIPENGGAIVRPANPVRAPYHELERINHRSHRNSASHDPRAA
mgnify:CR=1 FL=1